MIHRSDKVIQSKLGKAKCLNCGQTWGNHLGIKCDRGIEKTEFQPLGFAFSDRCDNCGQKLMDHHNRAMCRGSRKTVFENNNLFKEGDFLI